MKQLLNMSIILFGLTWLWNIPENPEWYWFFVIILAGVIIPELLFPRKKKRNIKKVTAERECESPNAYIY